MGGFCKLQPAKSKLTMSLLWLIAQSDSSGQYSKSVNLRAKVTAVALFIHINIFIHHSSILVKPFCNFSAIYCMSRQSICLYNE